MVRLVDPFGSGAVRLTRKAGDTGDPSLRLKNGYAQDDTALRFELKLHHYRSLQGFDASLLLSLHSKINGVLNRQS